MGREAKIKASICNAILNRDNDANGKPSKIKAFFAIHKLPLSAHNTQSFSSLQREWHVSEDDYRNSFTSNATENESDVLQSAGSMGGYSGSTFFTTHDSNYLVKSIPRQFEHAFFRDDLLASYSEYMYSNLDSLLIRITDFLVPAASSRVTIGTLLWLVPTHHIVMENLLIGRDEAEHAAQPAAAKQREDAERKCSWETWDLKPKNYFFPERDIAGGKLASEATKSNLADIFRGHICLSRAEADRFLDLLEKDTKVLEEANAVDYSLFLVRIPLDLLQNEEIVTSKQTSPSQTGGENSEDPFSDENAMQDDQAGESANDTRPSETDPVTPAHPPFSPPSPPTWRTGVASADGKYVFRAAILDFFWAKHTTYARTMTGLINIWNLFNRQGPMSITTTPSEYRDRFLKMCRSFVKVIDEESSDETTAVSPRRVRFEES